MSCYPCFYCGGPVKDDGRCFACKPRTAIEERAAIVAWLRTYGPCVIPGRMVYGPFADALDMAVVSIERGEHVGSMHGSGTEGK